MTNYNLIEIIYISSENNIIRHNIRVKEDWKLSDLIDHMVSSSIFTEEFLSDK